MIPSISGGAPQSSPLTIQPRASAMISGLVTTATGTVVQPGFFLARDFPSRARSTIDIALTSGTTTAAAIAARTSPARPRRPEATAKPI